MKLQLGLSKVVRTADVALPESGIIEFISDKYYLSELVVTARNGIKTVTKKTRIMSVDLSELMFAGELEMSIVLIVRGKEAKKWVLAPVLLTEVDSSICAIDKITVLEERIKALEEKTTVIL